MDYFCSQYKRSRGGGPRLLSSSIMPVMPTHCLPHGSYYVASLFILIDPWLQEGVSVSNSHPKKEKAKVQNIKAQTGS